MQTMARRNGMMEQIKFGLEEEGPDVPEAKGGLGHEGERGGIKRPRRRHSQRPPSGQTQSHTLVPPHTPYCFQRREKHLSQPPELAPRKRKRTTWAEPHPQGGQEESGCVQLWRAPWQDHVLRWQQCLKNLLPVLLRSVTAGAQHPRATGSIQPYPAHCATASVKGGRAGSAWVQHAVPLPPAGHEIHDNWEEQSNGHPATLKQNEEKEQDGMNEAEEVTHEMKPPDRSRSHPLPCWFLSLPAALHPPTGPSSLQRPPPSPLWRETHFVPPPTSTQEPFQKGERVRNYLCGQPGQRGSCLWASSPTHPGLADLRTPGQEFSQGQGGVFEGTRKRRLRERGKGKHESQGKREVWLPRGTGGFVLAKGNGP